MTEPRVLILANPYSGTGPNRVWVERFAAQLEALGHAVETLWDPAQRRPALQRERAAGRTPTVVAAGGDGSIAAVLNDMAALGVDGFPFTTMPVGNENLFARHFGITRDGGALAEAIARGAPRPMDMGVIHRDGEPAVWFSLMLSAGFDAEVVHRVDRWRKATVDGGALRRVNWRCYGPRIGGALRDYRYPLVTLTPDGGEPVTGAHAFVFNLPEYGKDLGICRSARADDGWLDWLVLHRPGRLPLANYLRAVVMGRHLGRPDVSHGRARTLTLTADQPVPLQADGDPVGTAPVRVAVAPAALRVLAPTA